jgi:hypothetical protein
MTSGSPEVGGLVGALVLWCAEFRERLEDFEGRPMDFWRGLTAGPIWGGEWITLRGVH